MKLTARDLEILKFINKFGFTRIDHIVNKFDFGTKRRAYFRLRQLVDGSLVAHERILYNDAGFYRVTAKGANFTELPYLAKVNLATYEHDIKLINLSLELLRRYPKADWISERMLKKEKHDRVGKRGHFCDGILVMPDDTQIAIELELTKKGKARLERIINGYVRQFEFKKIWYFCGDTCYNRISKLTEGMNFIETFRINDFI